MGLWLDLAVVLAALLNLVAILVWWGSLWPNVTSAAIVLISVARIMQCRLDASD